MRLFSKNHSFSAKATPEMRARNFLRVPGTNELTIEFTREPKADDRAGGAGLPRAAAPVEQREAGHGQGAERAQAAEGLQAGRDIRREVTARTGTRDRPTP